VIIQSGKLGVYFEVRDGSDDDEAVVREMWTEDVYQMPELNKDSVLVDIGANIGAVTVWAASQDAKVVAVEPQPDNRALLERNIERNLLTDLVTIVPAAVGADSGVGFITAEQGGSRLRPVRFPDTAEVPVMGLDELFETHAPDGCDVLKMDVEGSEYQIIAGADLETLSRIGYLTIEFHGAPDDVFGLMVAKIAKLFNTHILGAPERGGYIYARRY
jgi:FkbM family methyltransferase